MKKFITLSIVVTFLIADLVNAQGGLLRKVKNSVANEVLGKTEKSEKTKQEPEPSCASDQAVLIMDLGGKLKIDYRELSISILSDGRILAQHVGMDEYYIVQDGVTSGPYKSGDPRIADFIPVNENDNNTESFIARNKPYITKSGEKLLITFAGKKYGPYAQINNFAVSKSKEKFAAVVIENIPVNEDQGKKMDEAIKNAKNDQERMELAMKYTQQIQQAMMKGGGPETTMPKLVTNIPDASYDPMTAAGGVMTGDIKFDDILFINNDKIVDLHGKTVLKLSQEAIGAKHLFVNSNNTKYAVYNYGTLTFSDNTKLSELFNPRLLKVDGKVYLAYMYYSPGKNAIMQHKITF